VTLFLLPYHPILTEGSINLHISKENVTPCCHANA
jgi:hypothetical protein